MKQPTATVPVAIDAAVVTALSAQRTIRGAEVNEGARILKPGGASIGCEEVGPSASVCGIKLVT